MLRNKTWPAAPSTFPVNMLRTTLLVLAMTLPATASAFPTDQPSEQGPDASASRCATLAGVQLVCVNLNIVGRVVNCYFIGDTKNCNVRFDISATGSSPTTGRASWSDDTGQGASCAWPVGSSSLTSCTSAGTSSIKLLQIPKFSCASASDRASATASTTTILTVFSASVGPVSETVTVCN